MLFSLYLTAAKVRLGDRKIKSKIRYLYRFKRNIIFLFAHLSVGKGQVNTLVGFDGSSNMMMTNF